MRISKCMDSRKERCFLIESQRKNLRSEFGFKGVVLSDDIDSKATMRDCTVEKVAIDALNAGSDYLLLAAIDGQLERVVDAICRAVETGGLSEKRLYEAGSKIRALAKKYRI